MTQSPVQVFMVPGCSFMNVLAGSLYGVPIAVPFIALASTLGSSGSFWLSKFLLKVQSLQLSSDLAIYMSSNSFWMLHLTVMASTDMHARYM